MKPAWILFGTGGTLLFLALLWGLVAGWRSDAAAKRARNLAEQAEIQNLYNHCLLTGKEALRLSEDASNKVQGGGSPLEQMVRTYVAQSGTIEKGCEVRRRICENDFGSAECRRELQTAALFYAFHLVCTGEDPRAMSSPKCQELFRVCVAGTIEAPDCRTLLKQLGATQ